MCHKYVQNCKIKVLKLQNLECIDVKFLGFFKVVAKDLLVDRRLTPTRKRLPRFLGQFRLKLLITLLEFDDRIAIACGSLFPAPT